MLMRTVKWSLMDYMLEYLDTWQVEIKREPKDGSLLEFPYIEQYIIVPTTTYTEL